MHETTNNTAAVILFFQHLFKVLEGQDEKYQTKCVFILDCAPIQHNAEFLNWAAQQPEHFCFLSKYTWTLAAAEMAFAYIKRRRFPINDANVK